MPEEPKSIVLRKGGLQPATAKDLQVMAQWVLDSGYAPKSMTRASQVVIAIQHGMELGLRPMQSLKAIMVVNGTPTIYGDAALALVRKSKLMKDYKEEWVGTKGKDDWGCKITTTRHDDPRPCITTFTVADAKLAKLWDKDIWKKYPDRMLMFRSRGFNLRDKFGDVLNGLATYEEVMDYPDEAFTKKDLVDPEEQVKLEREAAAEAHRIEMEAVLATTKIDDDTVQDATFTDVPPANVNPETGEITDETQMPDAGGGTLASDIASTNTNTEDEKPSEASTNDSPVGGDAAVNIMTPEEKLLVQIREIEEAHPELKDQMSDKKSTLYKALREICKPLPGENTRRNRTQLNESELKMFVKELSKAVESNKAIKESAHA